MCFQFTIITKFQKKKCFFLKFNFARFSLTQLIQNRIIKRLCTKLLQTETAFTSLITYTLMDSFYTNFEFNEDNNFEIRNDEDSLDDIVDPFSPLSFTLNFSVEDHDMDIPSQPSSTDVQNTPPMEPDSQSDQAVPTSNENDGFEVLPAIIDEIFKSRIQPQNQAPFPAKSAKRTDMDRYQAIPGYLSDSFDSKYQEVKLGIYHKFNKILKRDQLHKLFELFCISLHRHELFKQYSRAANKRQGVMLEFFYTNFQDFRDFLAQTSINVLEDYIF